MVGRIGGLYASRVIGSHGKPLSLLALLFLGYPPHRHELNNGLIGYLSRNELVSGNYLHLWFLLVRSVSYLLIMGALYRHYWNLVHTPFLC